MKRLLFFFGVVLLASCSSEPRPIAYGKDTCEHCLMAIVDNQYATEVVTEKGKIYTFDSAECLMMYLKANPDEKFAHILTNHYNKPIDLIDATTATYLISENLPSPMGENLTAFATRDEAVKMQAEKGGDIYTFEELKKVPLGRGMQHHMP